MFPRVLPGILRFLDILAMMLCIAFATIVSAPESRFLEMREFLDLRLQASDVVIVVLILLAWLTLLQAFRLYSDSDWPNVGRKIVAIIVAVTLGSSLMFLFGRSLGIEIFDIDFIAWFGISLVLALIINRILAAAILHYYKVRWSAQIDYVVVGINQRSIRLVRSLEADSEGRKNFLGFVDIEADQHPFKDNELTKKYITDLKNFPEFLRKTPVDQVLICLPLKSFYDETMRIVADCQEQGVTVGVVADLLKTNMIHSHIDKLGNRAVITVTSHDMRGAPAVVKRTIDILVSASLLIALSPLMALTALCIVATSPGPAIFAQERVGLHKKLFRMKKFRTMVADAEIRQGALEPINEAQGPIFKIAEDPRITTVGRFLRKSSIDEIPQLLNVLKGEMSLVGPRPLPRRDYSGFTEDWHRKRLSVKPGITGLWQVNDRSHGSFDNWMRQDMLYIDQWSIWLDLKIILLTIPAVLRGSGQ